GLVRQFEERPQRRMVNNEVHLWPILGGLADIVDGGVLPNVSEGFLIIRWQKTFMSADGRDASFDRLLVERIHQLLIIEPPREFRRRERIANRVGLPGVWLVGRDRLVDLVHPSGLFRRDDGVGEQASGPGKIVDHVTGPDYLLIGEKPPGRVIEWRSA